MRVRRHTRGSTNPGCDAGTLTCTMQLAMFLRPNGTVSCEATLSAETLMARLQ